MAVAQATINANALLAELKLLGNEAVAKHSSGFFKTAPGQYGEGDRFLGVRMPVIRELVKQHQGIALKEVEKLLKSSWHEARIMAALLLVKKYQQGNEQDKKKLYTLYLGNTDYINNWDIVDCSAHLIVGPQLENTQRKKLFQLASSASLWERRIAVMATFHYIRNNDFDTTLLLINTLLNDEHDLIHKICGWMLREIGNRDREREERFLIKHYQAMPRTMLRYSIEKFPAKRRQQYLKGAI